MASYQNRLTRHSAMSQWDMGALELLSGWLRECIIGAHATVYGLTAYFCAYLVTHHPLEVHAALMAVAAGEEYKEENK